MIREYLPADKDAVINLVRLNAPGFFAAKEESDLSRYLEKEMELYYVLLIDGQIVGCGGINFIENRTIGRISWGVMRSTSQGKKLGAKLLKRRVSVLKTIDSVQKITVRTSQLTYRFYEEHGFILNRIKKDYWSKEFDMYSMELRERFR